MEEDLNSQMVLFEENYLIKTLGTIASNPEIALTELIANAWDSGASVVNITIPTKINDELIVEDDGVGLTKNQFMQRWMTLGYNRLKNQGAYAEIPPENKNNKRRRAYGRNGVGRHGMLCFSDQYTVETGISTDGNMFLVSATSGKEPFKLIDQHTITLKNHGTKLRVKVEKNLPEINKMISVLSSRFLVDPEFKLYINGVIVQLEDHKGVIDSEDLQVDSNIRLKASFIDSSKAANTMRQHGVVFWVGKKAVGEPRWTLGDIILLDGRKSIAKRYTVVVETDDLYEEVLADWTGFKNAPILKSVYRTTAEYVNRVIDKLQLEKTKEIKKSALDNNKEELCKLNRVDQIGVNSFVEQLVYDEPNIDEIVLSSAVKAVINLTKSRSGKELIEKLSTITQEDIVGLNELLDTWSVNDALLVLNEIDRRISVIEALKRLSSDSNVDELKTLHPLITQARWLFGPEFDSPCYTSNQTLINVVKEIFKDNNAEPYDFINYKKRPDIVVRGNSTFSFVGVEDFDEDGVLSTIKHILIIELKKGGFTIGRKEMNQAEGYIQDVAYSGHVGKQAKISAFVVGNKIDNKTFLTKKIEEPLQATVRACTFSQLISTAEVRLFNLRKQLEDRYDELSTEAVIQKTLFLTH